MAQLKSETIKTNTTIGITKSALGFTDQAVQEQMIRTQAEKTGIEHANINLNNEQPLSLDKLLQYLEQTRPRQIVALNLGVLSSAIFDAADLLSFLSALEKYSIELLLLENGLLIKPSERLSFIMLNNLWENFRLARKRENIRASRAKARINGKPLGRKPRGDSEKILSLRALGHSVRGIANLTQVSPTAVRRVLREVDKINQQ